MNAEPGLNSLGGEKRKKSLCFLRRQNSGDDTRASFLVSTKWSVWSTAESEAKLREASRSFDVALLIQS